MTKEMTITLVVMTVVSGSRDWQITLRVLGVHVPHTDDFLTLSDVNEEESRENFVAGSG